MWVCRHHIGWIITIMGLCIAWGPACYKIKRKFGFKRPIDRSKLTAGYFVKPQNLTLERQGQILTIRGDAGSLVGIDEPVHHLVMTVWRSEDQQIIEALTHAPDQLYFPAQLVQVVELTKEDGSFVLEWELNSDAPVVLRLMKKDQPRGNHVFLVKGEADQVSGVIVALSNTLVAYDHSDFIISLRENNKIAPTPGGYSATTDVSASGFTLHWLAATDDLTPGSQLQYSVCSALRPEEIDTIAECELATQELSYQANKLELKLSNKKADTVYYVNVIVKDASGNKAMYGVLRQLTDWGPATLAGAHNNTCRVTEAGELYCWGANNVGQVGDGSTDHRAVPTRVGASQKWRTVASGKDFNCGITTNGELYCWGSKQGALGTGSSSDQLIPTLVGSDHDWFSISAGDAHACAIKNDGRLYCWGNNFFGQLGDGTIFNFKSLPVRIGTDTDWFIVSAGYNHTCGIKTDRSLYCWGGNGAGQIGDGTYNQRPSPVRIGYDNDWRDVRVGVNYSCAVKLTGALYCWGSNSSGQLGHGTTDSRNEPLQVGIDTDWYKVVAGDYHTCGIKLTGTVYCWGRNSFGSLGIGDMQQKLQPVAVKLSYVREVVTGLNHSCVVNIEQEIYCWGHNTYGQIGGGEVNGIKMTPTKLNNETDYNKVAISSLNEHTCVIKNNGSLYCWGRNSEGQLGRGTLYNSFEPAMVGLDTDWQAVSLGLYHSCGLKLNGSLYCWGANSNGQLGDGTTTQQLMPVRVGTDYDWIAIKAGAYFTCAQKSNNTLYCWGDNSYKQLADGTTTPQSSPVQIGMDTDWQSFGVGSYHICAIKNNGTLYCWGSNSNGQLGNGSIMTGAMPTQIGADTDWEQVQGGWSHTCARKTTKALYCWGANFNGQLGDGTITMRKTPTQVGVDSDWSLLSLGYNHTCALKSDGRLFCWGFNIMGQLGNGTTTNLMTPNQVGSGTDWQALGSGKTHTCALKTDQSLWCWGSNYYGELSFPVWSLSPRNVK